MAEHKQCMAEHKQRMAEHEQRMAELNLRKHHIDLKAKEKAFDSELKAKEKELKAEERRMVAQHQHKRKKEQHEVDMLCLRMQFQTGMGGDENLGNLRAAGSPSQFGQFPDSNPFGNLGLDSKCLALVISQMCC